MTDEKKPAVTKRPLDELVRFIDDVESRHFRTEHDTGANLNAILIWNCVREYAGMKRITVKDLPAWCKKCKEYHVNPHAAET